MWYIYLNIQSQTLQQYYLKGLLYTNSAKKYKAIINMSIYTISKFIYVLFLYKIYKYGKMLHLNPIT